MNYLLEIGVEEIPAAFLPDGRRAFRDAAVKILADSGQAFTSQLSFVVNGSPRRLALLVAGLASRSDDAEEIHKGPPLRAAYDAAGKPTKAAEGFARKVGVTVDGLERDGEYVVARVVVKGQSLEAILQAAVPRIISAIPWPKSMRWNENSVRFVRPVRWIVSLLADRELPVSWAGVISSRNTYIRRSEHGNVTRAIEIRDALSYAATLKQEGILVDQIERIALIRSQVESLARASGGEAVLMEGDETFTYLADLVEDPVVMLGDFDATFTEVPSEVLELTMWKHQKYISIATPADDTIAGNKLRPTLLPKFLITANRTFGPASDTAAFESNVKAGNRRVLSARLSDAKYFWSTDLERPLIDRLADLERVTFQKDIGSIRQRVERIEALALAIAAKLGMADTDAVVRAVRLAKADLTTKMVFEFPELQGVIGRRLAEAQGESGEVARAIEEHYWPLGADPRIPQGLSAVVALAEKTDTILSIFKAGLIPTGSADPYGLRRAAIGIIRIILDQGVGQARLGHSGNELDLRVDVLVGNQDSYQEVLNFIRARALNYLAEKDAINSAVLEAVAGASVGWVDLNDLRRRALSASKLPSRPDFADMAVSFKRVMNILESPYIVEPAKGASALQMARYEDNSTIDPLLLAEAAEKDLHRCSLELRKAVDEHLSAGRVDDALTAMASIRPTVDKFFDDVLVNAEDAALRRNRKALLRNLGAVFLRILDFSKL